MPKYETQAHRDEERETLRLFVAGYAQSKHAAGRTFELIHKRKVECSDYDGTDATIAEVTESGLAPLAAVETKRRDNTMRHYPDYKVDIQKIDGLMGRAEREELVALYVVHWNDRIGYVRVTREKMAFWGTGELKRREMRDKYDKDPCYIIPLHEFTDAIVFDAPHRPRWAK